MAWILRMELDASEAEAISGALWDLATVGIAEIDDRRDGGFIQLLAGFATIEAADAARAALDGPSYAGSLQSMTIEPDDATYWVDPSHEGRLALGDSIVTFDLGQAFGDGGHPTTVLALQLLTSVVSPGNRVLDFGTGTGILAMAASGCGADRVLAVENDSAALTVARANLAPYGNVELSETLRKPTGDSNAFDVIAANILLPVHRTMGAGLVERLRPGGSLIVSGVLVEQEAALLAAYPCLSTSHRTTDGDWLALLLA